MARSAMLAAMRDGAKHGSSRSLLSGISGAGSPKHSGSSQKVPQFLGSIGRVKDSSRSLFGDEGGVISKGSLIDGMTEHTLPSL